MITAKIIYDTAVFKTRSEMEGSFSDSVQAIVEQPELHMLAICSSAVEDRAALIGDRNSCIQDLSTPLNDSKGTEIQDELVLFYGDKAAQQVERGTQQGGIYKCGSCGCEAHMMDDFAYSLRCKVHTLADLQSVALGGKFGNQVGTIRPFQKLNAKELQEELRARNVYHTCKTKQDLQKELARHLKGVQRVPTLLLDNPALPLADMNLQRYCVLDCEPLHDIKGHLANIFTELPHIIADAQLRRDTCDLLDIVVPKEKPSGGDYRRAAIHLLALLKDRASNDIALLVQTIVEISEILYADDEKRSNVTVLRLHNLTWLHYQLCKELFRSLHTLSRTKFFGLYLHAVWGGGGCGPCFVV